MVFLVFVFGADLLPLQLFVSSCARLTRLFNLLGGRASFEDPLFDEKLLENEKHQDIGGQDAQQQDEGQQEAPEVPLAIFRNGMNWMCCQDTDFGGSRTSGTHWPGSRKSH